MLKMEKIL